MSGGGCSIAPKFSFPNSRLPSVVLAHASSFSRPRSTSSPPTPFLPPLCPSWGLGQTLKKPSFGKRRREESFLFLPRFIGFRARPPFLGRRQRHEGEGGRGRKGRYYEIQLSPSTLPPRPTLLPPEQQWRKRREGEGEELKKVASGDDDAVSFSSRFSSARKEGNGSRSQEWLLRGNWRIGRGGKAHARSFKSPLTHARRSITGGKRRRS